MKWNILNRVINISYSNPWNFNFVKFSRIAVLFSVAMIFFSCLSIFWQGINFSSDFTGGIFCEIKSEKSFSTRLLEEVFDTDLKIKKNPEFLDRISITFNPKEDFLKSEAYIREKIHEALPTAEILYMEYVGPKISKEVIYNCIVAIMLSFISVTLYVCMRFGITSGFGGLLGLVHDVICMLGFYSISQVAFDMTAVAALLTIIGYSVNNTVIIHDRIRNNKKLMQSETSLIINKSINEVLLRTIMTTLTTAIVCFAIFVFSSSAIKYFGAAMLFGVIVGAFSSIYISIQFMILFKKN
ncbi:MAG: protein translocase subunit SecF [Proteobacteria bacterium]|nr:protein translocase subunit SecF [Pseudomonadota bacterium]